MQEFNLHILFLRCFGLDKTADLWECRRKAAGCTMASERSMGASGSDLISCRMLTV